MKESNFNATIDCFGRSTVVFGSSIVSADENSHCPSECRYKNDKWVVTIPSKTTLFSPGRAWENSSAF